MPVKSTSFDVAMLAGVSQPTVSRALRNSGGVNADTRKRILAAVEALDYRPDQRAVGLRSGSTRRIAAVILGAPDARDGELNPFYMALLAHVGGAAARRGFDLLVSFQSRPESFNADFRRNGVADAVVVIGAARNVAGWRFFAEARQGGEPIICWGSPADTLPTIRSDNRAGAGEAVRHLARQGRRRIAYLGPGWRQQRAYRDRRAGYEAVMRDLGLPMLEAPPARASSRQDQGAQATRKLIEDVVDLDAVFAASDTLAIGAIRAVLETGRSVPQDVAVVGYDGIGCGAQTLPSLTTVEQDAATAGERLVDAALHLSRGEEPDLGPIPCRLKVGDSTG